MQNGYEDVAEKLAEKTQTVNHLNALIVLQNQQIEGKFSLHLYITTT
jgi:hypothetical protein